ncbi:MAG: fluoride efflux transporter CrcB [Steroidobacteraceae bacterium]|nr:fluoride efflux transporter CrcB [Steroidobacteraceae bacterium]
MKAMILVGFGGLIGSVARYKVGGWVLHLTTLEKFPWSTFAVNVAGCFVAGILAALVEKHDFFTADTRLFLFTGLLGGFTTFSAFGMDALYLVRRGELLTAASYAGLSVIVGIAAVWLGFRLMGGSLHHA